MSNRKVSVYSHVIESLFSKSLSLYFAISGGAPIAFTYGILYNLILILAIIALSIPTVYYYSGYVYKNDPIVSLIVDIIHILTTVVILGIFCVKGKTQALLFFKINKIKNHMFKNYLYSNINSSMKTTLRIIIGNGLWLTCVIATFFHNYKYTLYFQGSMLCSFTKNSIVFQYCAISILLRDMFEMLNCKLLEMCAKVDGELQLSFLSVDIFNELSDLWDSHSKLTDICQEISSFYSLSIFTFIINQFMTTTIGVYYLSRPFFVDGVPDNTKLTNISEIFYLLRHIYILMFLTTSISATVNEVNYNDIFIIYSGIFRK